MQQKANLWAAEQMVGIIEEAHKGLEGLRRNDIGRMLNARFGMSWLISGIMKVQRGILLSGDNGVWDEINRAVGETTPWVRYRRMAFGIEDNKGSPPTLREQVIAGLRLYVLTASYLDNAMPHQEGEMVRETVARIKEELERIAHGERETSVAQLFWRRGKGQRFWPYAVVRQKAAFPDRQCAKCAAHCG